MKRAREIILASLPRFWGSRNLVKPCICSSPYLVMVKSNMAAKKGPRSWTSCNLLNTCAFKFYTLVWIRDRIRVAWQRDRPVTGGATDPKVGSHLWPKFKRPQHFWGCWGKFSGVRNWGLLRSVTDDPTPDPPLPPPKILGWDIILGFCPPITKNLIVRF